MPHVEIMGTLVSGRQSPVLLLGAKSEGLYSEQH